MTRCSSLPAARNNVSGDAGNDWIGIGGGAGSTASVLDGGDGDDFIGATADSNWLVGGTGNDTRGRSSAIGGDGNDQRSTANTLIGRQRQPVHRRRSRQQCGGRQRQRLARRRTGTLIILSGGDGNDWIGATGSLCTLDGGSGDDSLLGVGSYHRLFGGDGNDWVGVSGGCNFLLGDAGNDYLAATGNFNHFNGGSGNDQMVAAAGHASNRYIFAPGSGQDSITGFEGGERRCRRSARVRAGELRRPAAVHQPGRGRHRHRAQRRRYPDAQEHQLHHPGGQRFPVRLSGRMAAAIASIGRSHVNVIGSFVSGTAASDTFNLNADKCTVLGLDGDDTFSASDIQCISRRRCRQR